MPPRGTVVVGPLIRRICKAISIVCVGCSAVHGATFIWPLKWVSICFALPRGLSPPELAHVFVAERAKCEQKPKGKTPMWLG